MIGVLVSTCGGSSSSQGAAQQVSNDLEAFGALGAFRECIKEHLEVGEFLRLWCEFLPWWVLRHFLLCGSANWSAWSDQH